MNRIKEAYDRLVNLVMAPKTRVHVLPVAILACSAGAVGGPVAFLHLAVMVLPLPYMLVAIGIIDLACATITGSMTFFYLGWPTVICGLVLWTSSDPPFGGRNVVPCRVYVPHNDTDFMGNPAPRKLVLFTDGSIIVHHADADGTPRQSSFPAGGTARGIMKYYIRPNCSLVISESDSLYV